MWETPISPVSGTSSESESLAEAAWFGKRKVVLYNGKNDIAFKAMENLPARGNGNYSPQYIPLIKDIEDFRVFLLKMRDQGNTFVFVSEKKIINLVPDLEKARPLRI